MTAPVWLIAGREFRAYVATASFWAALAVGPVIMSIALLLSAGHGASTPPPASLTLIPAASGDWAARFSDRFPLSPAGQDRVLRILREDSDLQGRLRTVGAAPQTPIDLAAISRFAMVMILWMTLTGSLGMLLQAVVRERANRALESLLAAASPWAIVCGKLIGVGGVSLLVVGAWLGSSALLAQFAPRTGGLASVLLRGLGRPDGLIRGASLYLLAYALYGLATIAIGARARDNADAQNLARPMFAVLLAVFFAALASAGGGAHNLAWLVFIPPFTPFMLLMQYHAPMTAFAATVLLAAAAALAGWLAVRALTLDFAGSSIRRIATADSKV
jgi:ABC-type Na+ efflux pump permease subunit